jgi:porin
MRTWLMMSGRLSIRLADLVWLVTWVSCFVLRPAYAQDIGFAPWYERTQLTGDLFGARSALADGGITAYADNTSFFFGNPVGGIRRDFDYGGHGDYLVFVDGARRWGWQGFSVKLRAEHRFGETLVEDIGAFFSPTILANLPKENSERLYLTNVLFTQMVDERLALFAGKLDTLDGDMNAFAHGRGKTQFSNLAFVFNPIVAATVPYSTLGAGFVWLREGEAVAGLTVLNSTDTTGSSGFEQLFNDGVLISAYVRVPTRWFDMPGHQLFAGTWNNQQYLSLGDAYIDYPNLSIPPTRGSWSLFWNFDQYLVFDEQSKRGWGPFGRAGIADDNTNPLAWFLSFGLGGNSPISSRGQDTFGVGWYYAALSGQIEPILSAFLGSVGNGQGVECFYNYALTPAIHITPDLQVIVPSQREIDPALVLGVRAQVIF